MGSGPLNCWANSVSVSTRFRSRHLAGMCWNRPNQSGSRSQERHRPRGWMLGVAGGDVRICVLEVSRGLVPARLRPTDGVVALARAPGGALARPTGRCR